MLPLAVHCGSAIDAACWRTSNSKTVLRQVVLLVRVGQGQYTGATAI